MKPENLMRNLVIAMAVSDYKYRPDKDVDPFNGYEPGSKEFLIYQEKIEELKGFDYEQEQKDTARTLEQGE